MDDKPNIVLLHTDSMDGRIMGCMRHSAVVTPNLDRLAQSGVMFSNAYSNSPICVPSRASMFSGQYAHNCQAWNNYKGLSSETPTFLNTLEENGYNVQTFGKLDYLSGYHTIRNRVAAWTRSAEIRRPVHDETFPIVLDGNSLRANEEYWKTDIDPLLKWVNENEASQQPFFLFSGIHLPHPTFRTNEYFLNLIDPDKVQLPPEDTANHPAMEFMRIQKNWTHGYEPDFVRHVRRIYFAMVAEVDAMVGEVIKALEQKGLLENTYIIFTSDHGEMNMEHRQFYKSCMYEASAHVPMIISGPSLPKATVVDDLVSLVDIYPTLMDMAGIEHPSRFDGHSLMGAFGETESQRPDWVLSEFHGMFCNTGTFMLRRGPWKYIAYPGLEPMLFNLVDDPDEINNLVTAKPDIAKELDTQLLQVVDYHSVDKKVKEYDRRSFREWREDARKQGDYWDIMTKIFNGWEHLENKTLSPWTQANEEQIENWLADSDS